MIRNHRILWTAAALLLCVVLAVSALAEGMLGTMYRAAAALLFETDNVTLKGHVDFAYNGVHFKTMDAQYVQDGYNSLMDIKLKTPKADGTVKDSGFTVVSDATTSYSVEVVNDPAVYNTSAHGIKESILRESPLRRTILRLGSAVTGAAEGSLADKITQTAGENGGTVYHVQLQAGDTPQLINAAGTLLAQMAAQRYFYVDYDNMNMSGMEGELSLAVEYEDYDATFAAVYKRLYDEDLPDDFYGSMWNGDGSINEKAYERQLKVNDAMYEELVQPLREQYQGGIAVIHPDGSADHYEERCQYMADMGLQYVEYADMAATFRNYYHQRTGSELSQSDLELIWQSNNPALWEAYNAMYEQMDSDYLKLVQEDKKAGIIYVQADGSYQLIYNYEQFMSVMQYDGYTVTQRILNNMDALELGDTDVEITLDEKNRVAAVKGNVCILVTDFNGMQNRLDITLDCTAGQYGESTVAPFDPKEYGVVSWEEYMNGEKPAQVLENAPDATPAPENVTFDGVPYQLMLEGNDNG